MERYVALLRGINVSGKNKVSMSVLRLAFEENGFLNVITYINSGNVIFSSNIQNRTEIIKKIEDIIFDKLKLIIPLIILTKKDLSNILVNAPEWWGTNNKEIYDNAIFVITPISIEEVLEKMGESKHEYEKISVYNNVIFWSAILQHFSKTKWSKIASSSVNNNVTIRNANTVKNILELMEK